MKPFLLLLLAAGFAFPAGDPAGFHLWKAGELRTFPLALASQAAATGFTSQPLANLGNYSFAAVLRKQSGGAEIHETQNDVMIVTAGEATMVVGGTIDDAKTTQPHEIRGTSISGGVEKRIAAGDVLTVPAGTAHQVKVDPGKQIAYVAMKVAK